MKPAVKVVCLGRDRLIVKISNLRFLGLGTSELKKAEEKFARFIARAYPQLTQEGLEGEYRAGRDQELELCLRFPPPVDPRTLHGTARDLTARTNNYWENVVAEVARAAAVRANRRAARNSVA